MYLDQYTYGIMVCYIIAAVIWFYLSAFNFRWRKKRFIGCLMIAFMFAVICYRNYMFFIHQGNTITEDLMYTNYLTALLSVMGSVFIWVDRG